jgi:hypothetical protein
LFFSIELVIPNRHIGYCFRGRTGVIHPCMDADPGNAPSNLTTIFLIRFVGKFSDHELA